MFKKFVRWFKKTFRSRPGNSKTGNLKNVNAKISNSESGSDLDMYYNYNLFSNHINHDAHHHASHDQESDSSDCGGYDGDSDSGCDAD